MLIEIKEGGVIEVYGYSREEVQEHCKALRETIGDERCSYTDVLGNKTRSESKRYKIILNIAPSNASYSYSI